MTEDQLLTGVLELLLWTGWRVHHDRRSDKAITQGTVGFPDILAVHPTGRILAAELKSARGRVSPEQQAWLRLLAIRAEAHLWYPDDYTSGRIEQVVRG